MGGAGVGGGGGGEREHGGGAQGGGGAENVISLLSGEKIVDRYYEMNYVCPYTVPNSVKGTLIVTNYRLFFYGAHREGPTTVDVPLGCVSRIEKVGRQRTSMAAELAYGLDIVCKDIRSLRFAFNKIENKRKDIFETVSSGSSHAQDFRILCVMFGRNFAQRVCFNL
jgi:GRAM domain.